MCATEAEPDGEAERVTRPASRPPRSNASGMSVSASITTSAPAANAVTNAPPAVGIRSSVSRPATVAATRRAQRSSTSGTAGRGSSPPPAAPRFRKGPRGRWRRTRPTTTATGTTPSCRIEAPSTNDSGMLSRIVPSTIALALPASWLSPLMLFLPEAPRRSSSVSPRTRPSSTRDSTTRRATAAGRERAPRRRLRRAAAPRAGLAARGREGRTPRLR